MKKFAACLLGIFLSGCYTPVLVYEKSEPELLHKESQTFQKIPAYKFWEAGIQNGDRVAITWERVYYLYPATPFSLFLSGGENLLNCFAGKKHSHNKDLLEIWRIFFLPCSTEEKPHRVEKVSQTKPPDAPLAVGGFLLARLTKASLIPNKPKP